jgi:glycerol-3-phosphate O-acyltransferase
MDSPVADRGAARPPAPAEPYQPNPLLRWLYGRFFRHIHVDHRWSGEVKRASEAGVVVYVMRSISFLDFLCLDFLLKKFGLPLVRFVNDLGLWILEPFGKGGRRIRLRRQIPEDEALRSTVEEGYSALLFLRRPPRMIRPQRRGAELEVDLIRVLVACQRRMDRPILLVPQTFVWTKVPGKHRFSLMDAIFGPREYPGRIRVFFQFLFNYRNALLRSGRSFDLGRFVADNVELDDATLADKVRFAMLRRIERERTVVLGPTKKSPARIREELLRSPRVRKAVEAHARTTQRTIESVEKEAVRELKRLMAAQNPHWLPWLHRFLDWVWNRLYDGLVVDQEGIERVREAARKGTLILLPSHKSHVDYLVLSDVLFDHAVSPPLIAAGDNLSFWPLGPMLRRGGGFFIRRSFRGRKFYPALVDAYLRKLIVEGFNLEFFLEGGRSRTGKLLAPKFGLLSMVVDAALKLPNKRIYFVPISVGYERIIEERSYVHELSGGEKSKESISGLLKTPRVLRSRYGRLYVQFGEILDFASLKTAVMRERPSSRQATGDGGTDVSPAQRRTLVQRIGHMVTYEINRVTVVTPVALIATVLLAHRRQGIPRGRLVEVAELLVDTLRRSGATLAPALLSLNGGLRSDTLDETIALFGDGRLITVRQKRDEVSYATPDERRIAVEYYKNNILHFFVPSALIASGLGLAGDQPAALADLRRRVQRLSRMFKYEFMYRVDAEFDEIFDDALAAMTEAGEVEVAGDTVRALPPPEGSPDRLRLYANMIRTYFESYRLAARGARELLDGEGLPQKEWVRRTLNLGQRLYVSGEIELRESVSRSRLDNAVAALHDHGLIRKVEGDVLRLMDGVRPDAFDEVDAQLAPYLSG